MAKQDGVLQLRGTLENITFYKRGGNYYSRSKGGVDAKRIKTDPTFQRTRENWKEFEGAIQAGKLIRDSIRPMLKNATDPQMHNRMTSALMEVVQLDTVSNRGSRTVSNGPIRLIEGFELNNDALLSVSLGTPFNGTIDRVAGNITLDVPSFVPGDVVTAPAGATHFKIISAGVLVDFDAGTYKADLKESVAMPINYSPTADLTVVHTVPGGTAVPMMLIAGIQFIQQINGKLYALKNGAFNALRIVSVG